MMKTIMVVDDSASVRQVVNIILKNSGYDVIEASDGVDAMHKLCGRKVSLVICDVNMPNMDGITFVRTMKTSQTHKFTPVIMLTTESSASRKDEGRQAGAKAWFVKPFKPETMLEAVSKLVMPN
ncbi:MAG: two-component system response regulator [Deltaproteobacteria bacterium RIFCSPLOWO2_02_FULL_53_8]|nr:MAG: two-component system response regulator [Deltaproteobacteria bacterium RIFCSPLOWO2_02_FULL_53_8]